MRPPAPTAPAPRVAGDGLRGTVWPLPSPVLRPPFSAWWAEVEVGRTRSISSQNIARALPKLAVYTRLRTARDLRSATRSGSRSEDGKSEVGPMTSDLGSPTLTSPAGIYQLSLRASGAPVHPSWSTLTPKRRPGYPKRPTRTARKSRKSRKRRPDSGRRTGVRRPTSVVRRSGGERRTEDRGSHPSSAPTRSRSRARSPSARFDDGDAEQGCSPPAGPALRHAVLSARRRRAPRTTSRPVTRSR